MIGNPTTYRGKTVTWAKGRQLANYDGHTFTYDGQGRRLAKDSISFTYDSNGNLIKQSNGLEFFYDHTGVAGVIYNGNTYLYRKDVQNNVLAIINESGAIVARYLYDAWGNVSVVDNNGTLLSDVNHIGNLNPFRYRSYYYDAETKLYFLKTRYYDPETGRFMAIAGVEYLNPESIGGLNLYAYCLNNPVMYVDPTGHFAITTFLISLAIGTLISWGLSEILGSQIAGGISSTVSGGAAIYTGIGLLSFGPVGWIAGGALILIGAGTMAFGVNEIVAGATGTNYIQSWTGMSDGLYNGLYIGLNIASDIGTIAGNMYMKYANVTGNKAGIKGKPFSRYSTIDEAGVKQYRFFDSKGNAWFDKDFRHGGANLKFPHYHGWINGIRLGGHWSFWDLIKWLF